MKGTNTNKNALNINALKKTALTKTTFLKATLSVACLSLYSLLVACNSNMAKSPNDLQKAIDTGKIISLDESSSQGIINGVPVDSNDPILSSTVALYDRFSGLPFCTGTLLTNNILVTAAHCMEGMSPSRIVVGFGKDVDIKKAQFRRVVGGVIHTDYLKLTPSQANDSRSQNWGDLGLIKFDGVLPAGFAPAMILNDMSLLKNGDDVTLAGYGIIDGLKEIPTKALLKTSVQIKDAKFSLTEVEIAPSNGHAACHGDSGGPAFIKLNGRDVVFGATSRTATIASAKSCLDGSIYTVLSAHLNWLKTNIQKLNGKIVNSKKIESNTNTVDKNSVIVSLNQ